MSQKKMKYEGKFCLLFKLFVVYLLMSFWMIEYTLNYCILMACVDFDLDLILLELSWLFYLFFIANMKLCLWRRNYYFFYDND